MRWRGFFSFAKGDECGEGLNYSEDVGILLEDSKGSDAMGFLLIGMCFENRRKKD